jgi:hypothetical protein
VTYIITYLVTSQVILGSAKYERRSVFMPILDRHGGWLWSWWICLYILIRSALTSNSLSPILVSHTKHIRSSRRSVVGEMLPISIYCVTCLIRNSKYLLVHIKEKNCSLFFHLFISKYFSILSFNPFTCSNRLTTSKPFALRYNLFIFF